MSIEKNYVNRKDYKNYGRQKASLTIEAALVLPVFLYFMLAFLYYIQIFTVQEQIQAAITKMGLNLSKSSYVMKEFIGNDDSLSFDFTIFDEAYDIGLGQLVKGVADGYILKLYAEKYLNNEEINSSGIVDGFQGISFMNSRLLNHDEYIDIVVSYTIKFPIRIFSLSDKKFTQRVRLRSWTGHEVKAAYKRDGKNTDTETVFITASGTVYHKTDTCSHIRLSVTTVQGIPNHLRNDNGAKYYPCETCCKGHVDPFSTLYITSDGTRYHTRRDCSGIKRSVREIPITEVGNRTPCKRCYKE